jgi:hypothetical protein
MSEQVGKIEKPDAEPFKAKKKIYLVPLVYPGADGPDEYKEKCRLYWQQVAEQLSNLETKIGKVNRVYHEAISLSGEVGMKFLEKLNQDSYELVKSACGNGAIFEAVEDNVLFQESLDWERCFMVGFMTEIVMNKVYEFYTDAAKRRHDFMVKKISDTLKDSEAGLLLVREEHRLQFPDDIEVISVFPPALDEIHRWLRDQAEKGQHKPEEEPEEKSGDKPEGEPGQESET